MIDSNVKARRLAVDMLSMPAYSVAPMSKFGLTRDDPMPKLWEVVGANMSAKNQQTCKDISDAVVDEFACITIGCLEKIWYHEIEETVIANGGKAGWVRSVEHLLGFNLRRVESDGRGVPGSAMLAVQPRSGGKQVSKFVKEKDERLGAILKREGMLDSLTLDVDELKACIKKTPEPSKQRLHYNDSKAVAEFCWLSIVSKYKSVGCCILLFERLEVVLTDAGIPWPNKGTWIKVLRNRWVGARAGSAPVYEHAPLSNSIAIGRTAYPMCPPASYLPPGLPDVLSWCLVTACVQATLTGVLGRLGVGGAAGHRASPQAHFTSSSPAKRWRRRRR